MTKSARERKSGSLLKAARDWNDVRQYPSTSYPYMQIPTSDMLQFHLIK